jgi:ribosome biogenesis GTPase A
VLAEKIARNAAKGMHKPVKVTVVGIRNVGKSTLINQMSGRKGAKAENRPGVTRGKQWVTVDSGLLLLDTPGILWPKFEDPEVGMKLAYTGAVKEDILDIEELAVFLMKLLWTHYPDAVKARYGIEMPEDATGYELLEAAGRKRGFLMARAEVNTERMAKVLLDEYRSGKLGKFTLEMPPVEENING